MSSARENEKAEKGYKKLQESRLQYGDEEHLKRGKMWEFRLEKYERVC